MKDYKRLTKRVESNFGGGLLGYDLNEDKSKYQLIYKIGELEDKIENGTLVEKGIITEKALDIACRLLDDLTGNCPQCYEYDVNIDCDRECANLENVTSCCWKKYCIEQAEHKE